MADKDNRRYMKKALKAAKRSKRQSRAIMKKHYPPQVGPKK